VTVPFRTLGPSELLPRCVFVEPLFARRRVLEVGAVASTSGASARFLRLRGARSVVACDDDAEAVAAAATENQDPSLRFRACVFEDLEPASFDLLLVADLAPYVRAPALMAALLRLRAPHGVLVGGLRNPAGLALARLAEQEPVDAPPTFGQALDALSAHLPTVAVATQAPVLGYQLAFERSEGLQVDGSLAGEGEAAYYVLLASEAPVQGCEPVWVQLPPEPLAFAGSRLEAQEGRARQEQARARALAEALGAARVELDALAARERAQAEALGEAGREVAQLVSRLDALERVAPAARGQDVLSLRVRQLEQALSHGQAALAEAEARAERSRDGEARASARADEWARELEAGKRREQALAGQLREGLAALESLHAERDALAARARDAEGAAGAGAAALQAQVAALEVELGRAARQASEAQQRAAHAEGRAATAEELGRALRQQVAEAGQQATEAQRRAAESEARERALAAEVSTLRGWLAGGERLAGAGRGEGTGLSSVPAAGHSEAQASPPQIEPHLPSAVAGQDAGWAAERATLLRRVVELEAQLRERTRAHDALARAREETEARYQNSEQALRSLREALDAAARGR
jgi:hypothetical protein